VGSEACVSPGRRPACDVVEAMLRQGRPELVQHRGGRLQAVTRSTRRATGMVRAPTPAPTSRTLRQPVRAGSSASITLAGKSLIWIAWLNRRTRCGVQ